MKNIYTYQVVKLVFFGLVLFSFNPTELGAQQTENNPRDLLEGRDEIEKYGTLDDHEKIMNDKAAKKRKDQATIDNQKDEDEKEPALSAKSNVPATPRNLRTPPSSQGAAATHKPNINKPKTD